MKRPLGELVDAEDLNALLTVVGELCDAHEWDRLLDLARMCEEAIDRGKQLWPIAAHIDYRVALEAPGDYAASMLDSVAARWSHGPLTEVTASTHSWDELAPFIDEAPLAAYVAQERVLRGEDLTGDDRAHPEILELPMRVCEWEPVYCLATFGPDHAEVAEVWEPKSPMTHVTRMPGEALDDDELVGALLDVVTPWTTESNGAAQAVVVEGDAVAAVSSLTYDSFAMGSLSVSEALQRIAWAAASGGAHGRRRGAAFGRLMAWQLAGMVTDLPWPPNEDEISDALERVTWWRWEEGLDQPGWCLRLAVADESQGWAAAISATDVQRNDSTA
jgi:hypothetical protein